MTPPDNVVVLLDCDNPRLDGDLVGVDLGAHFRPRISPSKISSVSGKVARGSVDLKSREARP